MLQQIFNITAMNLRNIAARRATSSIIVVGIAGVVAVLVGLLAMSEGFKAALANTTHPDRALAMRSGTMDEISGWLSLEELNIIADLDGVAATSGELFAIIDLTTVATGKPGVAVARGVSEAAFEVRPEFKVVAGRRFEPGKNELMAGVSAAATYVNLEIGSSIEFRGNRWTVVGHFDASGRAHDAEIWMDLPIARAAFRRGPTVSNARVLLEPGVTPATINARMIEDPRLRASLTSESTFYAQQSEARSALIESFAYLLAIVMGIGAVIAALNTMHSSVSTRSVEIATLRSLGFSSVPIVVSVMVEAVLLASVGGVIGGAITYVVFDGYHASTLNNASLSQIAFDFSVTPELLTAGVVGSLALGFVGGLFPAVRAARLPIVEGLKG